MSNVRLLVQIRAAHPSEAPQLAEVAWLAKSSWGYSLAQLEVWREGLTPTPESIAALPTFVAEVNGKLAGFSQINLRANPIELEHLWVQPAFMRRGVGRLLLSRCLEFLASAGVECLHIDSDPNAEPFYLGCGAVRIGEVAAPIEGQPERVRPQMRISAPQPNPSFERTSLSWPRSAVVDHALRGQLKAAAQLKR